MKPFALASIAALAACGPMSDQFDGRTVTIDGSPYFVTKPAKGENFYRGMPDNTILQQGGTPRPEVYARSVRAIEAVAGCPVIVTSIENKNGFTSAAVACPSGTSPKY